MTNDPFRRQLKILCKNHKRNNRPFGHNWGCPCCQPFRMTGRNNHKQLARRIARKRLRNEIQE